MKILISHVYSSHNAGDAAILSAQISELKRAFRDPQLYILSVDAIKPGYMFDGIAVYRALMYGSVAPANNRPKKLFLAYTMMGYTLLWAVVFRVTGLALPLPRAWQKPMRLVAQADMQVCVGGGYLRAKKDSSSTVILLLLFHQIWLAKILRTPVYLYAQSFGPYPKAVQRYIAARGLRQADLILVREAQSKTLLASMGLEEKRIVQVPDSAFMFRPTDEHDIRQLLGALNPTDQIVGITVRAWLAGEKQTTYEKAMAHFIDHFSQQANVQIVIIPQVTATHQNDDDRLAGQRVWQLLKRRDHVVLLEKRFTHHQVKSLITQLDYLVGTRFHSVIFALADYVPVIAIEYEHKTSGIMLDLGLEKWVIGMEDVTAQRLIELFRQLVEQREIYLQHLQTVMPEYVQAAKTAVQLIKRAYEQQLPSVSDSAKPKLPR